MLSVRHCDRKYFQLCGLFPALHCRYLTLPLYLETAIGNMQMMGGLYPNKTLFMDTEIQISYKLHGMNFFSII